DGPVNYTVSKNTGATRTAAMYVNGKTFTVAQAGAVAARPQATREPARAARTCAMYVNGKTFTVAQAGAVQPQPQPTRQPVREAAALPPAPPQRKSEIARRPLLKKTKH